MYREILPKSKSKCDDRGQYSRYKSKKVIIVFIVRICQKLTEEKLNCLNFHEIPIGKN